MPPFPVRLRVDECLGGLKDRLPDLLKKIERFRAVFGWPQTSSLGFLGRAPKKVRRQTWSIQHVSWSIVLNGPFLGDFGA